ncbi:DUF1868 domain-containing protein [Lacrimispora sp.]|uniref:DUF1868 domain-containing protein n=1 Tax=Lacrimispora sp. TaxID=2719234 RepID=UPI0028A9E885|nr:DUF1868 domain-containing protein [Lacrimispora sp.]
MDKINTKNIGRKFNSDGTVRFFQGNTIISKIKSDNNIYPIALKVSKLFQEGNFSNKYSFLPDESFHMTIIQGLCDEDRKEELWSNYLPLDESLTKVDDFFEEKFKQIKTMDKTEMIFDYVDITNNIIIIRFIPKNENDQENLNRYRNDISANLGIKFPDHDRYGYHISIAYQLWEMDEAEKAEIKKIRDKVERWLIKECPSFKLEQPILTYFDNMFYFNEDRIPRH